METIDEAGALPDGVDQQSFDNPIFQGSIEEAWFDSITVMESDCDDDFLSVLDDGLSLNCFEGACASTLTPLKDTNQDEVSINTPSSSMDQNKKSQKPGSHLVGKSASVANTQSDGTLTSAKPFVSPDDVSILCVDEYSAREGGGILVNCGILPNNCLPFLAPTTTALEKRRSFSASPPNSKKKAALKLSFKRRSGEGNSVQSLFSTKDFLERPIAGSQVSFCPLEKKMFDCWSRIEPSSFRVRGENYFRDKKKEFAPNYAAYYPFGVDVYLCQQKISHISRFVELPTVNSSGKFPPILVVNVQVPFYPAAIFQNETDGEGMSIVLYFRLSESYAKELPSSFQENILKLINDEVERVKSFPMDTIAPFRDRLKILGRIANLEDLPLSAAESKLMRAYNEKPVLSRPQHEFYLGENYFEIDLDMHSFSYIPRKGFETFLDRLKLCVLDVGLTIQGNKPEELPEQVLCCVQLKGVDFANYHQLAPLSPKQESWASQQCSNDDKPPKRDI